MKNKTVIRALVAGAGLIIASQVQAAVNYTLTITNGGNMPISPAAIYVQSGQVPLANVGSMPSMGFVQLCQTGNPDLRAQELAASSVVKSVTPTMGPILPGQSVDVQISVPSPMDHSIQFEAMYGKTKDLCAVGTIGSHHLVALKKHVTSEYVGRDQVLQTGAFLDPALKGYLASDECTNAVDALSCLRELALMNSGEQKIRFFPGYLPSLITFLEGKYGTAEVKSLMLPTSGAVQFQLKLNH